MVFGTSAAGVKTQARIHPRVYRNREHRYYNDPDVYTKLGIALKTPKLPSVEIESAIKTLRNPIHRVVEFYATVILQGTDEQAFPLEASQGALKDALKLIGQWSNMSQRKQLLKRYTGIYGQTFLKVVAPKEAKRVQLQVLKPEPFTDFAKDDYGNINYVRLDFPFERDNIKKYKTEVWRKGAKNERGVLKPGYYRVWEWDALGSEDTVLHEDGMKDPRVKKVVNLELSTANSKDSMGFDFVPFVDVAAQDSGEKRPRPIYEHSLPLVDERNKMCTRQHDLLFRYNKPVRAVQGIGNDASGRPLAPPKLESQGPTGTIPFAGSVAHLMEAGSRDDLTLGGDLLFGLPGNAQVADITPNLNFEAARNAILDMASELREELPELIYYATAEKSQLSGVALRMLLAGAIDRAAEMRANIYAGRIKANKMALSIGQVRGLSQFRGIGSYDDGEGFEHEYEETEILPLSELEKEAVRKAKIESAAQLAALGVPKKKALEEVGLDGLPIEENPEGEEGGPAGDEITRAAEMLAARMGEGGGDPVPSANGGGG